MNERTCVEGVIDLLLVDPAAGRALLIDWKTNRITPATRENLQQRYRPQIAAYWKAVGEITSYEVDGRHFCHGDGRFMPYSANELEAEWTRLRALPEAQLSSVAASLWDA